MPNNSHIIKGKPNLSNDSFLFHSLETRCLITGGCFVVPPRNDDHMITIKGREPGHCEGGGTTTEATFLHQIFNPTTINKVIAREEVRRPKQPFRTRLLAINIFTKDSNLNTFESQIFLQRTNPMCQQVASLPFVLVFIKKEWKLVLALPSSIHYLNTRLWVD